ncbi:Basic-leucine zipper domain [Trinorchestia longiramus]|nr:Basic-leucine zipper domain [Trinorchestia longiramus]
MDMTSLEKLMEPLQEPDLAQARLDLPSWLLEDEAQLGFGHGAKEMHSLSPGVVGHASPPFITSDISDLDIYDQIDWDKPLSLEDYFPQDLKEQLKDLPAADATKINPVKPDRPEHGYATPVPELSVQHLGSGELPSPEVFLQWSGGIPAFVPPDKSDSDDIELINASPQVISVPISDAIPVPPSVVEPDYSHPSKSETPMVIIKRIPTTAFSQTNEPQKIVINLKRVSVFPKSSTPAPNARPSYDNLTAVESSHVNAANSWTGAHHLQAPTLKDVLSRNDAEDHLLDLLKPVPLEEPVSPSISIGEDQSYVVGSVESASANHDYISLMSPVAESVSTDMTYEELTDDSEVFLLSPESCSSEQILSPPHITSPFKAVKSSGRKPRASPYSPMEKKLRKKEQNKRAALRYRHKKKEEEDTILSLLQTEEARQKDLKEKYYSLQMEVRLLKNLMKEVAAKKKIGY